MAEIDIPPGLARCFEKELLLEITTESGLRAKCPFVKNSLCVMQEEAPMCDKFDEGAQRCDIRKLGVEQYILPLLRRRELSEGDDFWVQICTSFYERLDQKMRRNTDYEDRYYP